mmetsp:Transcript_51165/g.157778  ORF Transcript_51165/g.157778 Transcript_51165/m.157778 type:complete len:345 (-) Transcript_51165:20-1054(-)
MIPCSTTTMSCAASSATAACTSPTVASMPCPASFSAMTGAVVTVSTCTSRATAGAMAAASEPAGAGAAGATFVARGPVLRFTTATASASATSKWCASSSSAAVPVPADGCAVAFFDVLAVVAAAAVVFAAAISARVAFAAGAAALLLLPPDVRACFFAARAFCSSSRSNAMSIGITSFLRAAGGSSANCIALSAASSLFFDISFGAGVGAAAGSVFSCCCVFVAAARSAAAKATHSRCSTKRPKIKRAGALKASMLRPVTCTAAACRKLTTRSCAVGSSLSGALSVAMAVARPRPGHLLARYARLSPSHLRSACSDRRNAQILNCSSGDGSGIRRGVVELTPSQ